jgi:RNA polymerase sigma-70 factor (ECF subfamily)
LTGEAPLDEAWLVLRAQAGSRPHLEQVVEIAARFLAPRLVSLMGDPTDAEDVLQDVLFTISRRLGTLTDARLFRPWAHRTAVRQAWKAINRRRRDQARHTELDPDLIPASPEPPNADWVAAQLRSVSPASRVVLTLHYLDGLTIEATAAELGVAPGTVKSRLAYGLRQLREAGPNEE